MNYPYANGVLSAIDNDIFDRINYAKLIKTEKAEFTKILHDLGYGNVIDSIENIIASEMNKVKKTIDELSPETKYTDLFFFANDALNIKALYKKRIFSSSMNVFVSNGTINKEALEKAILENDYNMLKDEHVKLLLLIEESLLKMDNPRLISAIIDNHLFNFVMKKLRFGSGKTLKKYFQAFIDTTNVVTFIRVRALNWNIANFQEMFLLNGQISASIFEKIFESSNEQVMKSFGYYYDGLINKYLREYFEKQNLNVLEKNIDRMLIDIMKEHAYDSFKIGPMIYYYLKKSAEAKNIRAIYASDNIDISELIDY